MEQKQKRQKYERPKLTFYKLNQDLIKPSYEVYYDDYGFMGYIENGCGVLTGYNGEGKKIVLPSTLNGYSYIINSMGDKPNVATEELVISKRVTAIAPNVFAQFKNLKAIYYSGNMSEWKNVSIGENNLYLINAKLYFYSEVKEIDRWHYNADGEITLW